MIVGLLGGGGGKTGRVIKGESGTEAVTRHGAGVGWGRGERDGYIRWV